MDAKLEVSDTDAQRLQRDVDGLASLVALRRTWAGASPSHIARSLIDRLFGALALDLVYIRLDLDEEGPPIRAARTGLKLSAKRIDAALCRRLGDDLTEWPRAASARIGAKGLSLATAPLAFGGTTGILAAACDRLDFPTKSEALVLEVAADQLLQTLREQAERRVAASERDLRVLVDSIPAGVAWMSKTGKFEVINQFLLTYFGWTPGRLPRWGGPELIHPDDRSASVEGFNHSLETGDPFLLEQRQRRVDGTYRWFEAHVRSIRDASGTVARWQILHVDIEDRKRAEEALAASEHNARLIVDSIPGMVAVFSASGELEAVNRQVLEYFGATLDDLKDWDAGGFTHPEDGPRQVEAFTHSIESGEPFEWETRARRFDGVYRWFQSRGQPLRDASGRVVRWYNLLTDIDDRKRAETETRAAEHALDKARSDLAHAARAMSLGVLTASIAHVVNQPLSGIITNASTGLRLLGVDPPDLEGAIETMRRSLRDGNRAAEIIARLRTLFSNKAFAAEPVDLNDAAREVVALTAHEVQRRRIGLRVQLEDGLPTVIGDLVQLQQVILNLLLNACDATSGVDDRPRQIFIETAHDADVVRVAVRDTGIGLPADALHKLFDAFFTTKAGGMGIGLSVSRSIVERHGGRLWATTNDGPGATFAFSLPCARESAGAQRLAPPADTKVQ